MTSNGNQPAFPSVFNNFRGDLARDPGLTKREAAAIEAMAAFIASPHRKVHVDYSVLATDAVNQADALLAELEKREAGG